MKANPTTPGMTRRAFVTTTAAGLTALSARRVLGANERINVGLIGFGLIGRFHLAAFQQQPDVRIAAVCDVHRGRTAAAAAMAGGDAAQYGDFRKLLEHKNLDAVIVATPDHWHALMMMLACAAGKDVYVEKPLTLFVREGRWMLDLALANRLQIEARGVPGGNIVSAGLCTACRRELFFSHRGSGGCTGRQVNLLMLRGTAARKNA